jgi:hypothetical protein
MEITDKVIKSSNELRAFWTPRNRKFRDWYELIQLVDKLKTDNMESFVGSDPQASFKLLRHMLDQKIPHRLPASAITEDTLEDASKLENFYDTAWEDINTRYRRRGKQGFIWDLAGYLLATGWYAVMAVIPPDGTRCIAEVLNPASVFPSWTDDLTEVAHIDTVQPAAVRRMCSMNNWMLTTYPKSPTTMYNYWRMNERGDIFNSVVFGQQIVKADEQEGRLTRIPIFVAPVGGLPDMGLITGDNNKWKEEIGQASVATNEGVHKSMNKWWTFAMQLLRDSAQPRIKEKSRNKQIVKPEEVFKRGAIFRMSPEEDVEFMTPPPIPIEIRSMQLDMEAMLQRGGPSWAMFGNFSQPLTAYVMSQIAASTNQIAKPFHQGIINCITDIDNFWQQTIEQFGYRPYDMPVPKLPKKTKLTAEYEIRIPGDMIQRLTAARMADPQFRLSYTRTVQELFPEVKNPVSEKALIRTDDAERNPVMAMLTLIEGLRNEAKGLDKAGDPVTARLYEKAANKLEATFDVPEPDQSQPGQPSQARPEIGNRTEALPPPGIQYPSVQ